MSDRPWYKRFPSDFITATMHLTLEEKGAYSVVLDLIYDRGGPIPDDSKWIARVCGCSTRKWNTIRQRLIDDGKLFADDGNLDNKRAGKERVSAQKTGDKSLENAPKMRRKRAENGQELNENNDLTSKTAGHTRSYKLDTSPLTPQRGADGSILLKSETYEAARSVAPGWDIYQLEDRWRSRLNIHDPPHHPDKHFLGFCRKHASTNRL